MRNLNERAPDADAMLQNLFARPEGRAKIRASIIQPILNKLVYRSGWLSLLNPTPPDECLEGQDWEFRHEVPVTPFIDHIVQLMVVGLDAQVGAALQVAFTGGNTPRQPLPLTREAWEEARGSQERLTMAPATYNRLRAQDWFQEQWKPSDQMEETRVGWFGTHRLTKLRVTRGMPPDVLLFSSGPIGEVQLGLVLTEQADRGLLKWSGDLKVTLARKEIQLHQFPQ